MECNVGDWIQFYAMNRNKVAIDVVLGSEETENGNVVYYTPHFGAVGQTNIIECRRTTEPNCGD